MCTLKEEPAGTVMQQCGVGRAQRGGDCGVAFVAGGADGVEAPALAAQDARGEVEVAAADLRIEDGQRVRHRQG